MKRAIVVMVMAACGPGKKQPAAGGPGSGQDPVAPTAKQVPSIEAGCKAYAARCPTYEGNATCVADFGEASSTYKKCKTAEKLDAYTKCLVDDCFKTIKCDEGIAQCHGCGAASECTGCP